MITGVGGHQQADQMNMLSVWDKRCRAIAVLLLEWQQMSWVWIVRGYGGSLRKIWGWGRSVPRLLNEGQKEQCVQVCQDILEQLETEPNLLKRVVPSDESWIFKYDSLTKWQSLEWKSALPPRPKKVRVFKSKTMVMLITLLMSIELSGQNFSHKAKLIISTSTKTSCNIWCAQWKKKEENCGKRGHSCFIMTMLQLIMPWEFGSFLPKITLLYWSNHPTLQIWPLLTSFCFPNSRKSSKELVFKIQKPLKQSWWKSSEGSRRNPSRSAWKHGRGDRKSAFEPKEITLKVTCCKIYLSNKIKHL